MAHDPIQILQTLRRRSVEQARHALGACLTAEAKAGDDVRAINDAASKDRAAHDIVTYSHQFVEMFALRLRARESERRSAQSALTAAQARSAEANAAVVAARAAAEAIDTLIAERAAVDDANADRREQHALDDMARKRFRPGGSTGGERRAASRQVAE